jgi:hypothetical protein
MTAGALLAGERAGGGRDLPSDIYMCGTTFLIWQVNAQAAVEIYRRMFASSSGEEGELSWKEEL